MQKHNKTKTDTKVHKKSTAGYNNIVVPTISDGTMQHFLLVNSNCYSSPSGLHSWNGSCSFRAERLVASTAFIYYGGLGTDLQISTLRF